MNNYLTLFGYQEGLPKYLFNSVVVTLGNVVALASVNWAGVLIFVAAFVALRTFKINPILTMLCCGAANLFVNLFC